MKICFTSLGCPDWTVEEVAQKAATMHAYGVELRAKTPQLHINTETSIARVREIRRMFEDQGVKIIAITGYTQFSSPSAHDRRENEEQLERNVELCATLGADYVRTFIGMPPLGIPMEEICRYAGESLRRVSENCREIPSQILIETHDFASTGKVMRRILDCVGDGCDNIGAIWDISHPPKHQELPQQTWNEIGDRIRSVHIKDEYETRLPNGEIHQCFPGLGILPLKKCLQTLKSAKYNGYYVVEWERAFNMNLEPLEDAFYAFRNYLMDYYDSTS